MYEPGHFQVFGVITLHEFGCLADRVRRSWGAGTHVIRPPLSQLCCHCLGDEKRPYIFHKSRLIFFPFFEKKQQHFLSQNNLSPFLTRLPAIFTQLKLRMIYFQLQHSPPLQHMFLSIRGFNRAEVDYVRERGKKKTLQELMHVSFLEGAAIFNNEEFWAFIKWTAGPRSNSNTETLTCF